MKFMVSQVVFVGVVVASYLFVQAIRTKEIKYVQNRLFCALCLSSAVWGGGFWGVLIQTDADRAAIWRAFGLAGIFSYMIIVQMLICYLSDIKKSICKIMVAFSFSGILLYFFVMQKNQVVFTISEIGMTYYSRAGIWIILYKAYGIIIDINLLWVIIHMIRQGKEKRMKVLGKKFLVAGVVLMIGMVIDIVFPLLGKASVPVSTIGQVIALLILYYAVNFSNRFRMTISNMSEFIYYSLAMPVLVYDSDYRLQILNDAARSFFEVKEKEGEIERVRIDQLFEVQEKTIFQFKKKRNDVDAICINNQLYCTLAINKVYDDYGDNIGYIIIINDLSKRIEYIQKLKEAKSEAEYANKAKSIFLASMSHEIRTPMNAILGFSELVLKKDISDEVRAHVEDIKWSSNSLLAIINDILDISKIESGKMEIIPEKYYTDGLLRDVSLIIRNQAREKGLDFYTKIDSNIPKQLYGDKIRIRSILTNILNNAVKYTKKGSVTFEVGIIEQTEKSVRLEFKVSDTGMGIPKEEQEGLFKSFERLDKKVHYGVEGSGLGLAIANGYVTLMGGEIKVHSVYGEGSVFTILLEQEIIDASPMGKEYLQAEEAEEESTLGSIQISDTKVLVVDDNMVNLRVACGIMNAYGLMTDAASSGMEAIELCRKNQYPLVFMDEMMPEIDGIEAMRQIRAENPYYAAGGTSKIIVLTADAVSGIRNHLMEQGFDEYMGKPINLKHMERLLRKFLPPEKITVQEEEESEKMMREQEINYLKSVFSMVEIERGIANCGGDISDYLRILKITYNYGEKQLRELEEMQKQQDYENYTIKIHSMKSTSLSIGAAGISNMAKEQELAGKAGNYAYIDEHMGQFLVEYRGLLKKIEEVLKHYKMMEEDNPEEKEVLKEEMIFQILGNIYQYIDDFAFPKVFQILEEVEKYNMAEEYQEVFKQISIWMDSLSVDEIRELIEKTLEKR